MTFDLEPNEAAYIVRLVGSQPTESGAYPLHQKLIQQFQAQQPAQPPQEPEKRE